MPHKQTKQKRAELESENEKKREDIFEKVYGTQCKTRFFGRALAIDLSDAQLPGTVYNENKHMTVLYRGKPPFEEKDRERLNTSRDKWLESNINKKAKRVSFRIEKWGERSVLIKGELEELCKYLREELKDMIKDEKEEQWLPHVEIWWKNKW